MVVTCLKCGMIYHSCERPGTAESLLSDLDKISHCSATWNIMFNVGKSHPITMSPHKDLQSNYPIKFSVREAFKEEQSLELMRGSYQLLRPRSHLPRTTYRCCMLCVRTWNKMFAFCSPQRDNLEEL